MPDRISDKEFDDLWLRLKRGTPPNWNDIYNTYQQAIRAREAEKKSRDRVEDLEHCLDSCQVHFALLDKGMPPGVELSENDVWFFQSREQAKVNRKLWEKQSLEKENAELKETVQDWKDACQTERELVESKNRTIESLRIQHANG